jgi:hypothetical protein
MRTEFMSRRGLLTILGSTGPDRRSPLDPVRPCRSTGLLDNPAADRRGAACRPSTREAAGPSHLARRATRYAPRRSGNPMRASRRLSHAAMRHYVLPSVVWLLASGLAVAEPSIIDCTDVVGRTRLTAEFNRDLEAAGVPSRVIELRRAQIDFARSECRFSAVYSTGESRTMLLRFFGEIDGVAEYELELDELLTGVG